MPRYTWRKGKRRDGMMRLPKTYSLHYGSDRLAVAQEIEADSWFWYTFDGVNTANDPKPLHLVMAEAKSHFINKSN